MTDRITLRSERGPKGSRWLELRRDGPGTVVLEGHDMGGGVEEFWGRGGQARTPRTDAAFSASLYLETSRIFGRETSST
jgi:hypothetical protein